MATKAYYCTIVTTGTVVSTKDLAPGIQLIDKLLPRNGAGIKLFTNPDDAFNELYEEGKRKEDVYQALFQVMLESSPVQSR